MVKGFFQNMSKTLIIYNLASCAIRRQCIHLKRRTVLISGAQRFHWRGPNPDLGFCWRAALKKSQHKSI